MHGVTAGTRIRVGIPFRGGYAGWLRMLQHSQRSDIVCDGSAVCGSGLRGSDGISMRHDHVGIVQPGGTMPRAMCRCALRRCCLEGMPTDMTDVGCWVSDRATTYAPNMQGGDETSAKGGPTHARGVSARGTGSNTPHGAIGTTAAVGRQDSIASIASSGHSGTQQPAQTRGFYPPPLTGGAGPQTAAVAPAFPAVAPPVQGQGKPAWSAPNRGVYPDASSPTAEMAYGGPGTPAAAQALPAQAPAATPGPPTEPVAVPAVQTADARVPGSNSGSSLPTYVKPAPDVMASPPLYVPAPRRVSPGSSVPREDLWYTTASQPAGRASFDEYIPYPTVGVTVNATPRDVGTNRDELRAADETDSAAPEARPPAEVGIEMLCRLSLVSNARC